MRNATIILILIFLSGCANMTEREKTTALIVGGVVVGAIIISTADSGGNKVAEQNCFYHMNSAGQQTQVCR